MLMGIVQLFFPLYVGTGKNFLGYKVYRPVLGSSVDQSHGGAPKAGSTRRLAGRARVSVGSQIRGAEEGTTSRQGVEASGLGNPIVKLDRKRWFPSHTPVISKGEA